LVAVAAVDLELVIKVMQIKVIVQVVAAVV
jgi:hypothetical protein